MPKGACFFIKPSQRGRWIFLQLVAKKTDEGLTGNAERISEYPSSVTFADSSSSEELFGTSRTTFPTVGLVVLIFQTVGADIIRPKKRIPGGISLPLEGKVSAQQTDEVFYKRRKQAPPYRKK